MGSNRQVLLTHLEQTLGATQSSVVSHFPPPIGLLATQAIIKTNEQMLSKNFMIFDRSEGTMDWNYPWDLAGSVYRTWSVTSLKSQEYHLLTVSSTWQRAYKNVHITALRITKHIRIFFVGGEFLHRAN